jgi:hypothetical protein
MGIEQMKERVIKLSIAAMFASVVALSATTARSEHIYLSCSNGHAKKQTYRGAENAETTEYDIKGYTFPLDIDKDRKTIGALQGEGDFNGVKLSASGDSERNERGIYSQSVNVNRLTGEAEFHFGLLSPSTCLAQIATCINEFTVITYQCKPAAPQF